MRSLLLSLFVLTIPVAAQPVAGCPGIESAVKEYVLANFPSDDENPLRVGHKAIPVNGHVTAVQFTVPANGNENGSTPSQSLAFFSGTTRCAFVQQWDGEMTETIAVQETNFIFTRTEDNEADERHANFQIITVRASGEVSATRDQHGEEIHFSQTSQNRCEGKVGDVTDWSRDTRDSQLVLLRQRHTDRDAKCRVIEDSSTYRYYRLTADHWQLDEENLGE